jgi:hypothetical protein
VRWFALGLFPFLLWLFLLVGSFFLDWVPFGDFDFGLLGPCLGVLAWVLQFLAVVKKVFYYDFFWFFGGVCFSLYGSGCPSRETCCLF